MQQLCASLGLAVGFLFAGCESTDAYQREQEEAAAAARERSKKEKELDQLIAAEARAWETIEPMMREASNYNPDESFGYIGAVFVTERFYPSRLTSVARQHALGPYVSISQVFAGSPAYQAGLRPGDRILSVNGKRMPRWDRAARFAASKIKRLLKPGQMNTLEVSRLGETYVVEVAAESAAYYSMVVSPENHIDIRADGDMLWLSLDTVEKLEDDDEFAYACAFILAQNIMSQPEKRRKNQWLGQVFDIAAQTTGVTTSGVIGNLSGRLKHWAFNVEADLISLYLLSAAGYDVSKYPDFWHRQLTIAARSTRSGTLDHRDMERIQIINQVIASIEAKKRRGDWIFPEEYLSGNTFEIQLGTYAGTTKKRAEEASEYW